MNANAPASLAQQRNILANPTVVAFPGGSVSPACLFMRAHRSIAVVVRWLEGLEFCAALKTVSMALAVEL
jgi:hypothetical protein